MGNVMQTSVIYLGSCLVHADYEVIPQRKHIFSSLRKNSGPVGCRAGHGRGEERVNGRIRLVADKFLVGALDITFLSTFI
jgi:hypothetical protein